MGGGRQLPGARAVQEAGRRWACSASTSRTSTAARASTTPTRMVWPRRSATCNGGGVPMAIGVQTDMATPALARFGTDELRQEFLAPAISGDYVACLGVSRARRRLRRRRDQDHARKDGGDYVINGGKMWITNGAQADWMCLLANTGDGPAAQEQVADRGADEDQGRRRSPRSSTSSACAPRDTAQIFFDDVRVPQRYRIGERGHGLHLPDAAVPGGAAVGRRRHADRAATACIDATIDYTRERKVFGKPLLDNQVVHFRLAELQDRGRGAARAGLSRRARSTSPART